MTPISEKNLMLSDEIEIGVEFKTEPEIFEPSLDYFSKKIGKLVD